jgi:hypothetical protein
MVTYSELQMARDRDRSIGSLKFLSGDNRLRSGH